MIKNSVFRRVYGGLKFISRVINTIVNFVILNIVYIVGIGITLLIVKIFKIKLSHKHEKEDSYWLDIETEKEELSRYLRQF